MRTILILVTLVIACSAKSLMRDQLTAGCIQLFENCGYQGRSRVICKDDPQFGADNDLYSAIKLGPGTTATVFENFDYGGKYHYFNADESCFFQNSNPEIAYLNDQISAVRINIPAPGCADLYADCDYSGRKYTACMDVPDLRVTNINFNDLISSVRLGAGTSIQLFEHVNYQGRSLTLTKDEKCFFNDPQYSYMNDIISAVKLIKN
jgi:hypothetical protein